VIIDLKTKKIMCLRHGKGRMHDFKLFPKSQVKLPKTIKLCNYSGLGVDKERKISIGDKRDNRIQGVIDRGQSLTQES